MRGKILNTFPKMHWSTWWQENGTCRGYLDGWQYKLPDFSCEAETMERVHEILSAKLDEWKGAT